MKTNSFPAYSEKLNSIQSELSENQNLLIVSKGRSLEEIQAYYDLGHRDFGENRVQELKEKSEALKLNCPNIRWHMIGNLQSNKINQLFEVQGLWAIHSVDNADILQKLIKASSKLTSKVRIFLQFNTSKESQKSGFEDYESLLTSAKTLSGVNGLMLYGLMTMGTLRTESFEEEASRCFHELGQLKMRLENELSAKLATSMGMSQDYKIALLAGSNWIRLGTIMF